MGLNKLLTTAFLKLSSVSKRIAVKIENTKKNDIQTIRCIPWFKDNGDRTLRVNYNLNENSLVVDLGGYEGQWASDIFNKYACNIYVFEPYLVYADNIRRRFSPNPKVRVFDFGLSNEDKKLNLGISSDSSSLYKKTENEVVVDLKKASDFFRLESITFIDLLKINIEGGEYDVLEHLIETDLVKNIGNIQVQFHDFVPDAESRMRAIQNKLSKTHETTYQYEFVWENWKKRTS